MEGRWPAFYERALQWLNQLEQAIYRQGHPEQGAFIAITNAIEFQFEIGADETTVWHLLEALRAFTMRAQLKPETIGLGDPPDSILAKLRPETR